MNYQLKKGYKQTEVGVIPEDWEAKELGELGDFKNGINKNSQAFGHGLPFVNLMDVFGISFIRDNTHLGLVNSNEMERKVYDLRKGDVLFVRSSVKPSGVGLTTVVIQDLTNTVYSGFLIRFRDEGSLDINFKKYCFSEEKFRQRVISNSTVSANTNINQDNLKKLLLVYPGTIKEQRSIATVLSDVDALLDSLDRLIAKKRDLKQATMQQLLTGQTRLPGLSGEWEVKRLGDVVDTDPENLSSETLDDFIFNYISLEDVDHGTLKSFAEQKFINAPSRARRKLRHNDVLISTVRPNLKSHFLFKTKEGEWVASTGFCVVRCRDGITFPGYILHHFFAGIVNQQIEALLTGSNYPAINSGDVRALEIPVPTYAEQKAIATVLSDMDAEIAALEQRRDKTRNLKQGMMQELLTGRTRLIHNS